MDENSVSTSSKKRRKSLRSKNESQAKLARQQSPDEIDSHKISNNSPPANNTVTAPAPGSSNTVTKITDKAVISVIGQKNYNTVLNALCSLSNVVVKSKAICALLTNEPVLPQVDTKDAATQTVESSFVVNSNPSEHCLNTNDTPSNYGGVQLEMYSDGTKDFPAGKYITSDANGIFSKPQSINATRASSLNGSFCILDPEKLDIEGDILDNLSIGDSISTNLFKESERVLDKMIGGSNMKVCKQVTDVGRWGSNNIENINVNPIVSSTVTRTTNINIPVELDSNKTFTQYIINNIVKDRDTCMDYDECGYRPLHCAILDNDLKRVNYLHTILKMKSTDIDEVTTLDDKYSPLQFAIIHNSSQEMITLLMKLGCSVLARDCQEKNALHHCALQSDPCVLQAIINSLNINRQVVLPSVADNSLGMGILVTALTDTDSQGNTPLMQCVLSMKSEHMMMMLQELDSENAEMVVNFRNPNNGMTALCLTAQFEIDDHGIPRLSSETQQCVKLLCGRSADWSIPCFKGNTPLQAAQELNNTDFILLADMIKNKQEKKVFKKPIKRSATSDKKIVSKRRRPPSQCSTSRSQINQRQVLNVQLGANKVEDNDWIKGAFKSNPKLKIRECNIKAEPVSQDDTAEEEESLETLLDTQIDAPEETVMETLVETPSQVSQMMPLEVLLKTSPETPQLATTIAKQSRIVPPVDLSKLQGGRVRPNILLKNGMKRIKLLDSSQIKHISTNNSLKIDNVKSDAVNLPTPTFPLASVAENKVSIVSNHLVKASTPCDVKPLHLKNFKIMKPVNAQSLLKSTASVAMLKTSDRKLNAKLDKTPMEIHMDYEHLLNTLSTNKTNAMRKPVDEKLVETKDTCNSSGIMQQSNDGLISKNVKINLKQYSNATNKDLLQSRRKSFHGVPMSSFCVVGSKPTQISDNAVAASGKTEGLKFTKITGPKGESLKVLRIIPNSLRKSEEKLSPVIQPYGAKEETIRSGPSTSASKGNNISISSQLLTTADSTLSQVNDNLNDLDEISPCERSSTNTTDHQVISHDNNYKSDNVTNVLDNTQLNGSDNTDVIHSMFDYSANTAIECNLPLGCISPVVNHDSSFGMCNDSNKNDGSVSKNLNETPKIVIHENILISDNLASVFKTDNSKRKLEMSKNESETIHLVPSEQIHNDEDDVFSINSDQSDGSFVQHRSSSSAISIDKDAEKIIDIYLKEIENYRVQSNKEISVSGCINKDKTEIGITKSQETIVHTDDSVINGVEKNLHVTENRQSIQKENLSLIEGRDSSENSNLSCNQNEEELSVKDLQKGIKIETSNDCIKSKSNIGSLDSSGDRVDQEMQPSIISFKSANNIVNDKVSQFVDKKVGTRKSPRKSKTADVLKFLKPIAVTVLDELFSKISPTVNLDKISLMPCKAGNRLKRKSKICKMNAGGGGTHMAKPVKANAGNCVVRSPCVMNRNVCKKVNVKKKLIKESNVEKNKNFCPSYSDINSRIDNKLASCKKNSRIDNELTSCKKAVAKIERNVLLSPANNRLGQSQSSIDHDSKNKKVSKRDVRYPRTPPARRSMRFEKNIQTLDTDQRDHPPKLETAGRRKRSASLGSSLVTQKVSKSSLTNNDLWQIMFGVEDVDYEVSFNRMEAYI